MNNDKNLKLNLDTVNFNRCAIDYDEMPKWLFILSTHSEQR